ncbi:MAG: NUDIX hydrolase [Eubacterium sp.]|nr:NUDIX hydrolase [Eubacterium sp.]
MSEFEKLDHKLLMNGHIVDYYEDTLRTPDGNIVKWDLVDHKGAAAVVAVKEDGSLLMVSQYRNTVGRQTLEIPAGGRENREEPYIECAARELEEETGYRCGSIEPLISLVSTIAFSNEIIEIFVAKDLTPTAQHLDEDEFINVTSHTPAELRDKILSGEIQDGKTIAAIMAYIVKYGA